MKLLVAEGEPIVLDTVKSIMELDGCEVSNFEDSRKAARLLETEKFNGLLVEARMPNLDGFEFTRRVRALSLNTKAPVVMLIG